MKSSASRIAVLVTQALLVVGFAVGLGRRWFPLGVPGEWEWLRLSIAPNFLDVFLAAVGLAIYAFLAGLGFRFLAHKATATRAVFALLGLTVAALAVQAVAHSGAPMGYGLAKWIISLHQKGSSGYFTVASTEVHDPRAFLAAYPEWIQKQDPLHIGTHPPGLIMIQYALIKTLESHPALVRFVDDFTPASAALAAKVGFGPSPLKPSDRATLVLTGAAIMAACSLTVLPLYGLARCSLKPEYAWACAAFWPLVPSAVLFQPTADTAFPVLTTLALYLAAASRLRTRGWAITLAVCAGLVLALGMQLSLVFLPVGLIVGVDMLSSRNVDVRRRFLLFLVVGVGFLGLTFLFWGLTGANPFAIWWWNQKNHARFYTSYPRSYWPWVFENALELAVGLGLPAAFLVLVGTLRPKGPAVSLITAFVLIALTVSGKSLSEVGRLWIPFMPALLPAAASAFRHLDFGPKGLAFMVLLIGLQTLALEAFIQVVYPV